MCKPLPHERKGVWNYLRFFFGFYKNPPHVEEHLKNADVNSMMWLSSITVCLEIFFIIRFINKYMLTGVFTTAREFIQYSYGYWILLTSSLLIFFYSLLYRKGRLRRLKKLSRPFALIYTLIGIYFGVITSISDLHKGRMILCFLSMFMFLAMVFICRPFISILLISFFSFGFVYIINHYAVDVNGAPYHMDAGDQLNYFTFVICLLIVALSIYFQRYKDATKAYGLRLAAITDDLTKIPNMQRFSQLAKGYVKQSLQAGKKPYYLVFDVRNFMTFNDCFGYDGGNDLLRTMAILVEENFSDGLYARQSDDYFIVLTDAENYAERAQKVRSSLKETYQSETYLDVIVGAYYASSDNIDPMHAADLARYALGKIKNNNALFIKEYDEQMGREHRLRQYVLNNIDKAVSSGYIKVYYQPVIWSADGGLCGCEALARWDDPEMGFLSPYQFIPVLEDSRQIHKLDRCVYEIVFRNMRSMIDQGLPVLPTSLNFSQLDFELMDVIGELEALTEKYDVPRKYIHIEITESALSEDVNRMQNAMLVLHNKGYMIWLDDFGSGYSSMNVLKDFRFDLLKIDMEFLRNFSGNENAYKIIRNIIILAGQLNMATLTEGVENQEAVDFLREAGCDRLQGFFYGKPMPYEEILAKIADGTYHIHTEGS
ncbi:diguanylate cyclase (GGDEF) domain-containing protein [Ruminococcus sp. YE71]|uniref:bifunctional diguanylate cyclase/phosphodiesterase n=1 Tax=unclassified Ruminococcus TaxID=2608920 RepID=UPI00088873F5|nr:MULTISPECIES: bifunctional diguanylate cyclase/phosphodiesterase [unclassified Ruminococcus]SDA24341.1 diguanylate cyclase (GGDEF) domain-containing protein [Ruminococcus sp. YE78]SFW41846.1 diguanylate cyclase (GGDEF) domain-containing protein [Ruminococcus sp. YE71]